MDKKRTDDERLQKFLAKAGIASRRKAEELIVEGRVKVNGQVVDQLGAKVKPTDRVMVDGVQVRYEAQHVYILLYKPSGVVTTVTDPQGRKTVLDFIDAKGLRIYPVGRLDYETSGLLLLTNDGDFAHRMMHPRHVIAKQYEAVVEGKVSEATISFLQRGVTLEDGRTAPAKVSLLGTDGLTSRLLITIHQGRNRQVRRMVDAVGHPCLTLVRTKYGTLTLRGLRPGEWRYLTERELESLNR